VFDIFYQLFIVTVLSSEGRLGAGRSGWQTSPEQQPAGKHRVLPLCPEPALLLLLVVAAPAANTTTVLLPS